jgi:hypothetical protein
MQDFRRARNDVLFTLWLYCLSVALITFFTFLWI